LTGCLKAYEDKGKTPSDKEYEMLVVFALCWGIGGVYETEDRKLV